MGFALTAVDGSIVDYVIPLKMDSWVDTSEHDVVVALEAGAFLNIVGSTNNNEATPATVRVYDAGIVMLDDSDPERWFRTRASTENGYIEQIIYDTTGDGGT